MPLSEASIYSKEAEAIGFYLRRERETTTVGDEKTKGGKDADQPSELKFQEKEGAKMATNKLTQKLLYINTQKSPSYSLVHSNFKKERSISPLLFS